MDVKAGVTEAALFPVSFKLISERFVELSIIGSLRHGVCKESRTLNICTGISPRRAALVSLRNCSCARCLLKSSIH